MTDHPCKGMTRAQIEAFERIAINESPKCAWPTIEALLKKEVIAYGTSEVRKDAMGVYHIPQFHVPLHIHMQWCQWCSEQPENKQA
jgi:hypothetical protein